MLQKQPEEYKLVAILCSWTETSVTYTVGWENKWMSRGANQKCGKDWLVWGLSCRGESSNLSAFTFSTAHSVAWPHPPPRSPLYQHTEWLYTTHGSGGHEIIKMCINYWILYQRILHSPWANKGLNIFFLERVSPFVCWRQEAFRNRVRKAGIWGHRACVYGCDW